MGRIIVVGSITMDIVAIMDRFPEAGETLLGNQVLYYHGGKGANQCVAVKRLNGDAEMIGMVGGDGNGDSFMQLFKREGIKHDNVLVSENQPTGITQIQIDANGQNRICAILCANGAYSVSNLQAVKAEIAKASMVITQLETNYDVVFKLVEMCYELKVPIMLNPAPAAKLPDHIIKKITYLTPNETELSILTDMPAQTDSQVHLACKKLYDMGVKCIVATLGSRGAYLYDDNGGRAIAGFKVKPVDTVGAGDSFNGAFAVAVSEGKSHEQAVVFANAMGALTVQKKGAIDSMHSRAEVDKFIKDRT